MVKVKTFTTEIKIFQAKKEIDQLDETINQFLKSNGISKVISVCDSCTTGDNGATIGLIRSVTYEAA
ncbi:MAG: hypothetical protein ABID87_05565 [Chloroflexota bacterium]